MLSSISLQNFRNYKSARFEFKSATVFVVGKNTSGKTNLVEAIYFLSSGRSFRGAKDEEIIMLGENFSTVSGKAEEVSLDVRFTAGDQGHARKKYLVNGVPKRRQDFAGNLPAIIFVPEHLEIIGGGPGQRRNFMDEVLEQVDLDYRLASSNYEKGLRQRNALLETFMQKGLQDEKNLDYWSNVLIENGRIISAKREEFTGFINGFEKDVFDFNAVYDKSEISQERLDKYKGTEISAGVTLVGPHRDDLLIQKFDNHEGAVLDLRSYGSRGEKRLAVLQLKIIQLEYIKKLIGQNPMIILDDIFSELDEGHIKLVMEKTARLGRIITTTHKEFLENISMENATLIEL